MQSTHATQATHRVQRTHPSVATHARRPTPRNVRTLASTPQLPAVARLPATATLPDVATLPATATLPAVATLPATAMLPAVATLPATATLPAVAALRATAVRSLVSAVRTTWERVAIAALVASVPACPRRIPKRAFFHGSPTSSASRGAVPLTAHGDRSGVAREAASALLGRVVRRAPALVVSAHGRHRRSTSRTVGASAQSAWLRGDGDARPGADDQQAPVRA